MKKSLLVLFLFSISILFAQQSSNPFLNKKKSTHDFSLPNTSYKYSLNLDSFKLKKSKQNNNSLSELLTEKDNRKLRPIDNMPIFEPSGKFYMKIFHVDEDIDYKLRIFELQKSKYNLPTVG